MVKIVNRGKRTKDQLAHVTQEMYKQNLELAERNKTLTLLRRIDELVLGPGTETIKITQTIAELLVDESDFTLSMLYVTDKTKANLTVEGLAAGGKPPPPSRTKLKEHAGSISLKNSRGNVLRQAAKTGKVQLVSGLDHIEPSAESDADDIKASLGVQASFVCPLKSGSGLIGALVLGVPVKKDEVSDFLKNLSERLATTISIAVENYLLYEELQEAGRQLRVQNQKLRQLDKTKDEFISMASHQLRTPLTTVKGYLSMILEGDMGAVKKEQKDLMQLAFDGANRMVYLIADLLNVSRLQTGKFVIDNKPTDLADVVQVEITQLKEQAANRQIEMAYKKPEHFPILNLDETKIRQVVMNFLDNALYYTPKGGKVDVALAATDDTFSYTVTDTGVGVPQSVQHHLFAKFYRADNARKMRPDGTGLGLYMAKKVIVAQGGAIIFKSTEGKGSTFGFSFPRKSTELKGDKAVIAEPPKGPEIKLPPSEAPDTTEKENTSKADAKEPKTEIETPDKTKA